MIPQLYTAEHRTVASVAGPLLVAEHAEHVGYDELVDIVTPAGDLRRGQVLDIEGDRMIVQVSAVPVDSTSRRRPSSSGPGPPSSPLDATLSAGFSTAWGCPSTAGLR